MSRTGTAAVLLALAIVVADTTLKWMVTGPLGLDRQLGGVLTLLPVFDLRFVSNCGVSLGLLQADSVAARWGVVALTAGIATGVLIWAWREQNRVDRLALAAVFGGAISNIADRVLPPGVLGKASLSPLHYPGCVIDYADLHFGEWRPFLVFNLADAAISLGVVLLLIRALLVREKRPPVPAEKSHA